MLSKTAQSRAGQNGSKNARGLPIGVLIVHCATAKGELLAFWGDGKGDFPRAAAPSFITIDTGAE